MNAPRLEPLAPPATSSQGSDRASQATRRAMLAGLRVLHVEDDKIDRRAMDRLAAELRLDITSVRTLDECETALLYGRDFDILVADLNLPDGRFTDLTWWRSYGPPTLILTGSRSFSRNEEEVVRHCDLVMTKDELDLPTFIDRLWRLARLVRR